MKKKTERYKKYSNKINDNINEIRKELYGDNPNYKIEYRNNEIPNEGNIPNINVDNLKNQNDVFNELNKNVENNNNDLINNFLKKEYLEKEKEISKSQSLKVNIKEGKICM